MLDAAAGSRLHAYVVLSLLVGARTEELRPVTWDDVDLTGQPDAIPPVPPSISIVRSVPYGENKKLVKSERRQPLAVLEVETIQEPAGRRPGSGRGAVAGDRSRVQLERRHAARPHNVRRGFIKITQAAAVRGDWTPRELRHSSVSLLSDDGMSIERISHLVGHKTTRSPSLCTVIRCRSRRITSSTLLGSSRRVKPVRLTG